jgi:hydroxyacylglutathione hydrolase
MREGTSGKIVDVRRSGEWQAGHIPGATHFPLNVLAGEAAALPKDQPLAVICASGFRSSIATSVLERQGFTKVTNVVGGMTAWRGANLQVAA